MQLDLNTERSNLANHFLEYQKSNIPKVAAGSVALFLIAGIGGASARLSGTSENVSLGFTVTSLIGLAGYLASVSTAVSLGWLSSVSRGYCDLTLFKKTVLAPCNPIETFFPSP